MPFLDLWKFNEKNEVKVNNKKTRKKCWSRSSLSLILNIFWNIFEYNINVIANFEQALFGEFWLTLNNCLSTIIKPFSKNQKFVQWWGILGNFSVTFDTTFNILTIHDHSGHIKKVKKNIATTFLLTLHKKWSIPSRFSSVKVTKPAVSCGFGHIYCRKMENFILCAVLSKPQRVINNPWIDTNFIVIFLPELNCQVSPYSCEKMPPGM